MSFQFTCPKGHLLEAEEEYIGQETQCPECNAVFPIPEPEEEEYVEEEEEEEYEAQEEQFAQASWSPGGPPQGFDPAAIDTRSGSGSSRMHDGELIVHVSCSKGHVLETPISSMGEEVICPYCGDQFYLRYNDTLEHQKKIRDQETKRVNRLGKIWLIWSIVIAVLVIGMFIGLVASLEPGKKKNENGDRGDILAPADEVYEEYEDEDEE